MGGTLLYKYSHEGTGRVLAFGFREVSGRYRCRCWHGSCSFGYEWCCLGCERRRCWHGSCTGRIECFIGRTERCRTPDRRAAGGVKRPGGPPRRERFSWGAFARGHRQRQDPCLSGTGPRGSQPGAQGLDSRARNRPNAPDGGAVREFSRRARAGAAFRPFGSKEALCLCVRAEGGGPCGSRDPERHPCALRL